MKIISWNVNSVRTRLERIVALLKREAPDALCLQELKATEEVFPYEAFQELGYLCLVHGQKTYNGVAILIRQDAAIAAKEAPKWEEETVFESMQKGFEGDPIPEQARVLSVSLGELRLINVYVVNGKDVGHEYYDLKLRWLKELKEWIAKKHDPSEDLLICGDFNIAPEDRDVYDSVKWEGHVLCTEAERASLNEFVNWGLWDLHRRVTEEKGVYTWWDYRHGAFPRGWGLRIDLFLATSSVAKRLQSVTVDREERKKTTGPGKPSDHAPVIVTLKS